MVLLHIGVGWFDGMEPKNLHTSSDLQQSNAEGSVLILLFQKRRNMKVAVASVLRTAE